MNYSKQILEFAEHLVYHHAKYDDRYSLDINNVYEFDKHEFAAIIMASDDGYANEATSCDNPWYETIMLPALLSYLKNSTDKDAQIEFNKAWLQGISKYFEEMMQTIINEKCRERLQREHNENSYYGHISRQTGEVEWRHA